jgi:hypothetical protein
MLATVSVAGATVAGGMGRMHAAAVASKNQETTAPGSHAA